MRRCLVVAVLLGVAACAELPPAGESAGDVDALFTELERVATLPPERQRAILAEARERHERSGDARSAVRLALVLSIPGTPFQDDEGAALVLEPFAKRPARTSMQRYAALLRRQLWDKARLERRSARLRDELAAARAMFGAAQAEDRQVATLVSYAHWVSGLPPEQQREELLAAQVEFAERPADYARLRLALLLSLSGTPLHDQARALVVLEPLTAGSPQGPLPQFGALLHGQLRERMRDRRRTVQLKEQLEALRAIERSLIERKEVR
ncbi:MAG TPA: hypothetical protein VK043_03565 [Burkholderiales bacterium]|nr:hypothetical protein [Burkholderiales bacterium]